jgi:hypothetical protein
MNQRIVAGPHGLNKHAAGGSLEQSKGKRQKKKAGRVVRLTPDLVTIIVSEQGEGETIPNVIRRLLGLTGSVRYVLPSDIYENVVDARGVAVLRAVNAHSRKVEKPVPVRPVK